jgi:hypothetical protein
MGVSGQRHAPAALLPPGKGAPVPTVQEAGWASEPVWTQRLEEKSFAPAGDRTPIARSSSPSSDTILPELPRLHDEVRETNEISKRKKFVNAGKFREVFFKILLSMLPMKFSHALNSTFLTSYFNLTFSLGRKQLSAFKAYKRDKVFYSVIKLAVWHPLYQ